MTIKEEALQLKEHILSFVPESLIKECGDPFLATLLCLRDASPELRQNLLTVEHAQQEQPNDLQTKLFYGYLRGLSIDSLAENCDIPVGSVTAHLADMGFPVARIYMKQSLRDARKVLNDVVMVSSLSNCIWVEKNTLGLFSNPTRITSFQNELDTLYKVNAMWQNGSTVLDITDTLNVSSKDVISMLIAIGYPLLEDDQDCVSLDWRTATRYVWEGYCETWKARVDKRDSFFVSTHFKREIQYRYRKGTVTPCCDLYKNIDEYTKATIIGLFLQGHSIKELMRFCLSADDILEILESVLPTFHTMPLAVTVDVLQEMARIDPTRENVVNLIAKYSFISTTVIARVRRDLNCKAVRLDKIDLTSIREIIDEYGSYNVYLVIDSLQRQAPKYDDPVLMDIYKALGE